MSAHRGCVASESRRPSRLLAIAIVTFWVARCQESGSAALLAAAKPNQSWGFYAPDRSVTTIPRAVTG